MKAVITATIFLAMLSMMPMNLVAQTLFAQTSGSPAEKDFVSSGKIEITLESGDYDIRASSDNRIHVRWNEASGARVKLMTNGKSADLRVENTPHNNFHATIEVPALTDLRIRLTAGDLRVSGIKGDKDIEANAGNLNVSVGSSSDWGRCGRVCNRRRFERACLQGRNRRSLPVNQMERPGQVQAACPRNGRGCEPEKLNCLSFPIR